MVSNVLVIEDMPIMRDMLCDMLCERWCVGVRSAEEGLELLGRQTFDLLITDIKLPGMSGIDLLRFLKSALPMLPVIVITGGHEELREADFLDMGAIAYLEKPFTVDEFERAVGEALGEHLRAPRLRV
jgi:DNA-binding NtrC family response regulator